MNEKAKAFAWFWCCKNIDGWDFKSPHHNDCCHVYLDGFVLVVPTNADEHLKLRDMIKDFPGFEEAKVQEVSVFVVPMEVRGNATTFPNFCFASNDCQDHREIGWTYIQNQWDMWQAQGWQASVEWEELQRDLVRGGI